MPVAVLDVLRSLPGGAAVLERLSGRDDVWLVGGAVRDALLGREPRDIDLLVEGDAAGVAALLGDVREAHDRFGTFSAVVDDALVNVATARTETYARPGALPDVEPSSLADDLARRDFTVNAVAVDLAGELHAVPGAQEDLEARRLRVLHDGSFLDDPTRLWRLARYAARLEFAIEERTLALAREAVAGGVLTTVTGPRIGNEVALAVNEPDPLATLVAAHELGLLPTGMAPRRALTARALALLPEDGHPGILALAASAGAMGEQRLRGWLDELGLAGRERDQIVTVATGADALAAALGAATRPSEVHAAARGKQPEHVALAGALGPEEAARNWLETLRDVYLEISGDDLLAEGIPPGPEMGRRLDRALAAKLDGEAPDRDAELAVALA
ncbi:MAG: CCA tRNA nucleotidyltransferase [Solirubrobacteraceae bacterium]